MAENGTQEPETTEDLAEGYPTLDQVARAILADDTIPHVGVQSVQINCFASRDATYRVWVLGEDEPRGNYLGDLA